MLQKTYRTRTLLEYEDMIKEITETEAYQKADRVLAVVLYETWEKSRLSGNAKKLKEDLPKVEIAGTCNGNEYIKIGEFSAQGDGTTYTFIFFDTSDFRIFKYDTSTDISYIGSSLSYDLAKLSDVKAVMVFFAHPYFETDGFFRSQEATRDDYPMFGIKCGLPFIFFDEEQHASSNLSINDLMTGFVVDENGAYTDAMLAIAFYGKDLHAKASYNFGWTPVGRVMTITKTNGPFTAVEIDGKPANSIYKTYLNLEPEHITTNNISEFPLISIENGRSRARIGANGAIPGSLEFFSPIREGERIQFSYGNENNIFNEAYADAKDHAVFQPEALFMSPCINRYILMQDREYTEFNFFKEVQPQVAVMRGFGEALRDRVGYGLYNSAMIILGLREGDAQPENAPVLTPYSPDHLRSPNIPLVSRLATFLEQTTDELKEMAKQANAANNAKSAFLSNMSHEVRTPINAILGLDEMILNETHEESTKKYASDIQSSGKILLSLINEVLDISRLESGRMEIIPLEYEFSSTINDLSNLVRIPMQQKNLEYRVRVDENIPRLLYGDETRIKQCVANILTNAVKYTEDGSISLDVSCEHLPGEEEVLLTFRVKDTGIGIKPEDMPKLTQPFERIEEIRNHSIEGTGLGMAIVSQLLKLMDSELHVESTYGEGSDISFTVRQKIVDRRPLGDINANYKKEEKKEESQVLPYTAPEAKILVCDDNEVNLLVFCGLLKDTKVQITTTTSGQEAIDAVRKETFDVIFLDQRMPHLSGTETLQKLKELPDNLSKEAPVLILTATAVTGAREEFLKAGFNDYLSKPVNAARLKEALFFHLPKEKIIYD